MHDYIFESINFLKFGSNNSIGIFVFSITQIYFIYDSWKPIISNKASVIPPIMKLISTKIYAD